MATKKEKTVNVSSEDFVNAWQTSETHKQMIERTGLTKAAISSRASFYRAHGVILKKLSRSGPVDWSKLQALAANLGKGK